VSPGPQADERIAEAAIGSQPSPAGGREFVPPARCVASTPKQTIPLAAVQHIVQDRLAGGLLTQAGDLPCSSARTKETAMHGVEDRELQKPERFIVLHATSLRRTHPKIMIAEQLKAAAAPIVGSL
jgi:hypothetical protein